MGEVYRAFRADDQFRMQVAVKLVRTGGATILFHRFKNERQILATLEHPNIARLLDGGTADDGRPYFVMEFVDGRPVDEYCRDQGANIQDRLEIFLRVCSAVQYAHQHLIIHRDLKPGNILVTRDGEPKLLDFGIAKILDSSTENLGTTAVTLVQALTPSYASPEQVKGEVITTASDIYSLGVVLYELLTGRSPYPITTGAPQEIFRAVMEFDPEKPSVWCTLDKPANKHSRPASGRQKVAKYEKPSKYLRGDLDNIILMALRKEPARRYASVEQFADDIRRHMQNMPIRARKDTLSYRTSKFINRHRAVVSAVIAQRQSPAGRIEVYLAIPSQSIGEAAQSRARRDHTRGICDGKLRFAWRAHSSIGGAEKAQVGERVISSRMAEVAD